MLSSARAQAFSEREEISASLEELLDGCKLPSALTAYFVANEQRERVREGQTGVPLGDADGIVYLDNVLWRGQPVDFIQFERRDNGKRWRMLVQFRASDQEVFGTFFLPVNASRDLLPPSGSFTTGFVQLQGRTSLVCQNAFGPWLTEVLQPVAAPQAPPTPVPQEVQAQARHLEVCNRTSSRAELVIASLPEDDSGEVPVKGWILIAAKSCVSFRVESALLHVFARTNSGFWSGKERFYCVPEKRFQKVAYPDEKCSRGETRVGTFAVEVPEGTKTIELKP